MMTTILMILRLWAAVVLAVFAGRLVAKIKLPSILGWLIAGMVLGPYALGLIHQPLLDAGWYKTLMRILECGIGLMIGTELVWKTIKKSGKQIIVTTLTESMGTFVLVTLSFGAIFYLTDIPLYLAFLFGSIALATAPAPALSIIREFNTNGPVTKTLMPMAALDNIVAVVVFFSAVSVVSANITSEKMPLYLIVLTPFLPLIIGAGVGLPAGQVLKKQKNPRLSLATLIGFILAAAGMGFIFVNLIFPGMMLNFMLIGIAFSTVFANIVSEEKLKELMVLFYPILGVSMIAVMLNLGTPLDYHLISGAGVFTAVYILTRTLGKYFGAYWGATVTKAPETVKKYLGLTLLPHSGVSLVFTGIAVSMLAVPAPQEAKTIQGTIAAAAIINEIIAVLMAKKGFELAGEMESKKDILQL
ncbi:Kef-type K+ transport system, membrane component [Desulfitobacterium dehalogenans ATCC 51507]|uniref:Kef-type K+ transport system, membrane component n=1 Tax=Desulfitobacterium dehalogenans (strain ATCC 51507 / DSM 9161 / JW/IU-DC1) TaxID=756499 RepID=I4A7U0_DESDJ|nr:cation:proton antiporter [Desulfitobacterium dehalogenans]AFM00025.1 Kef-type K+ transport system, membrane component [Desulfitobacterium dehalogenans ATCC 51507]